MAQTILGYSENLDISVPEAYDLYQNQQTSTQADKALASSESWGENNRELRDEAEAARWNTEVPSGLTDYAMQNIDSDWMKKAVDLWHESGLKTYPTGIDGYIKSGERNGQPVKYFVSNKTNYPVTDEQIAEMKGSYNRQAALIIKNNDDAEVIAKKLSSLPGTLKKQFIGGE